MNLAIGDYEFKINDRKIIEPIQDISFYKEHPDLFLNAYTDLDKDKINKLKIEDKNIANIIIDNIYSRLTMNDSNIFIKTVNNANDIMNNINGILMIYLSNYYNYRFSELLEMSPEKLLTLFTFELRYGIPTHQISVKELKEVLSSVYDEELADSFIDAYASHLVEAEKANVEQEIEDFINL